MKHIKAIARNNLALFEFFQNKMRDNNVSNCEAGEKILKKSPGFATLKNSPPAIIELGILLAVETAITMELKTFANKTPLATATDAKRIIFFIFLNLKFYYLI